MMEGVDMSVGVNVGLDSVYYAIMTADPALGIATYSTPKKLAKAIDADMKPKVASGELYADNGMAGKRSKIVSVEVKFGVDKIRTEAHAEICGHKVDANGVLIVSEDDKAPYIALGFRSELDNGECEYVWLYKGIADPVADKYKTEGEKIDYQTKEISLTFMRRDSDRQLYAKVNSGDDGVGANVITNWFASVYQADL